MRKALIYEKKEILVLIKRIWPLINKYKVLALHGELGAGKTTFTTALCAYLGVAEIPDSPTFSIINIYSFKDKTGASRRIYHSDWYRLRNTDEALDAGIEDMLQDDYAFCIIEWPEKAEQLLPDNTLHIYLEVVDELKRKIILSQTKIA